MLASESSPIAVISNINTDLLVRRILAQFEHLAETYFSGVDYDLGERELDHALQLDSDLDMFAAAIGLTKTAIQTIQKDDGTPIFSLFCFAVDCMACRCGG